MKHKKAIEWGVGVVDLDWLWDLARNGLGESSSGSGSLEELQVKPYCPPSEKGSEKEKQGNTASATITITDITNSTEHRSQRSSSSSGSSSHKSHKNSNKNSLKRSLDSISESREGENEVPKTTPLTFGVPTILSSQPQPLPKEKEKESSAPPIKRSRTVIEPMQSIAPGSGHDTMKTSHLTKSKTDSSLDQRRKSTLVSVPSSVSVSNSPVTTSAERKIDSYDSHDGLEEEEERPGRLKSHLTLELRSTITNLLHRSGSVDPRSDDDPIGLGVGVGVGVGVENGDNKGPSRRERPPARTKVSFSLVSEKVNERLLTSHRHVNSQVPTSLPR